MVGNIPRGYKKTDVGIIPEDWNCAEIGQYLKIRHGRSQHDVEDNNGKYPIMATGGLIGYANAFLYDKPSVLIGRKGTIDVPQYIDIPFWTIDTLFFSEISKQADAKYVYYLFQTIDWYMYNEASGVPSLNAKIIEQIKKPIPPLPEQIIIANTISDIDLLISSIEKLIKKKNNIKQGAMQELLTGKTRLDGFSGEWKKKTIYEFADISTGNKNTQDMVSDGVYPFFVRSQNIEYINSYSFDGEAVLTAGDGVGVGKVFHYINGKFDFHQRVYKISNFKGVNGRFFYEYFKNNFLLEVMKYTAKSSVDSVRMEMIAGMLIPVPPTIEEQRAIAQILSDMDKEIEKINAKLTKYKEIKQGMMQELLTGKRRLI